MSDNINHTHNGGDSHRKIALITGITGQDGSYLAEFLLSKDYEVHGIIRRASTFNTKRIDHLYKNELKTRGGKFHLHYGDMTDSSSLIKIISTVKPDEIYNLAAQSHVKVSFELSEYTGEVVAIGTLRLLEAIRICKLEKKVKFYQASSSELYGKVAEIPQSECTPFYPRSPYSVAKLYAYWIVVNYRESYGMFACNGILFNHESPRRGETFVTRKITRAAVRIKKGLQDVLELGNLNAERDWGHAEDYVRAMWLMLQQDVARDLVISSGKKHTVREFTELAFMFLGIKIQWRNTGLDEVGLDENGKVIVRVNERYFRPAEVDTLLGDCSKAKELLGWAPNYSFHELVKTMVEHDLAELESKPAAMLTTA